jgi:hypothetical protein
MMTKCSVHWSRDSKLNNSKFKSGAVKWERLNRKRLDSVQQKWTSNRYQRQKNAISNTIYRKNWTRRNITQANETRNTTGTQKHSHPSWGRVTTNRRGCRFLSFSGNSSMQLTNCPVTATKITCNSLLFGILWSLLQNPPWELNWPRSHWKSQTQACQQAVVR